jgi:hypothetical protein
VDLVQIDIAKRVVFDPNPSGFYYWTSVYYADLEDWPNYSQLALDVVQLEHLLCTEDVELTNLRIKNPPGRTNVVFSQNFITPQFGDIPSEGEFSLIQIARWHLFDDEGRRSYRLNRMPLRPSDWEGQELTPSGMLRQVTCLNTFIGQGWARNSHGSLITSGEVVQRLTMWQLRHGTRRRRRNPVL